MMKFTRAYVSQEEIDNIRKAFVAKGYDPKEIEDALKEITDNEVWLNDIYQVNKILLENTIDPRWNMYHLSIKRRDRQIIRDWRQLQWIKNELVGPENEGVEKYPAESQKVDTSNQYHIWVFADPTLRLPFGFINRCVTEETIGKTVQRKFDIDLLLPIKDKV